MVFDEASRENYVRPDIQAAAQGLAIRYLVHFTRSENLGSILKNGLRPRSDLDNGLVAGFTNDDSRHDNRRDRNCLSIGFPNYKMFFKLRMESNNTEWPILFINPAILWQNDCVFCHTNAAAAAMSSAKCDDLKTLAAFSKIFQDDPANPSRATESLRPWDPTDVQAEVLVRGTIAPEHIFAVAFQSHPDMNAHKAACGDRQAFISDRRAFYGQREFALRNGNVR